MQTKEIENVFNATAHDLRRNTEVFHCISQFVLDVIGDESSSRILTNDTNDVGEIPRRKIGCGLPVNDDWPSGTTKETSTNVGDSASG